MIKKLKCLCGLHEFYVWDIEMVHIADDAYRITMPCRNCGEKQCRLIRLPIPPWIEKRKQEE